MSADLLASLAAEIDRLWRHPARSWGGLRQIARGLLLEAGDAAAASEVLRLDRSEANSGPRDRILLRSLLAGRVAAWMAVHFAPVRPQADTVLVAALISDAGRLRPKREIAPADDPAHPAVSASLAAGLTDAPVGLPRLVARHHERSDGTGFPGGLPATRLLVEDRLLAAAVRFAEVFTGDATDAVRRLHEEARRGAFDADLTANLAWSISGTLPADAGLDRPDPRPWALTDRGRRRLRLDAPHPALRGPHFGRRSAAVMRQATAE